MNKEHMQFIALMGCAPVRSHKRWMRAKQREVVVQTKNQCMCIMQGACSNADTKITSTGTHMSQSTQNMRRVVRCLTSGVSHLREQGRMTPVMSHSAAPCILVCSHLSKLRDANLTRIRCMPCGEEQPWTLPPPPKPPSVPTPLMHPTTLRWTAICLMGRARLQHLIDDICTGWPPVATPGSTQHVALRLSNNMPYLGHDASRRAQPCNRRCPISSALRSDLSRSLSRAATV
jgi:hypothetical protein